MKKIIYFLIFSMLISLSANAQFCNKYADKAVAQYKLAKKNNLPNIILPFWSDDWSGHYNWCKTVSEDIANKHNELRQAYLDKNIDEDGHSIYQAMLALQKSASEVSKTQRQVNENAGQSKYNAQQKAINTKKEKLEAEISNSLDYYIESCTMAVGVVAAKIISDPDPDFAMFKNKLPPGIAIKLKYYSKSKASAPRTDKSRFSEYLSGKTFKKYCSGYMGTLAGYGWCWYESTGLGFNNWSLINDLPRGTVVGLKHNLNQPNKKLIWQDHVYDPANPNIQPPPGFARKEGGDMGASVGKGYFWYEKITGK